MAEEIKLSINNSVTNGDFKQVFQPGTVGIDQSAVGMHAPVVIVPTTGDPLDFGDISTPGIVMGRNLDSSNYVLIGPSSDGTEAERKPFQKVKSGEPFAFRIDPDIDSGSARWAWKADTANVKMQIQVFED